MRKGYLLQTKNLSACMRSSLGIPVKIYLIMEMRLLKQACRNILPRSPFKNATKSKTFLKNIAKAQSSYFLDNLRLRITYFILRKCSPLVNMREKCLFLLIFPSDAWHDLALECMNGNKCLTERGY